MWSSTVGLVNGKHRYLTAETFGFKINSNGQVLKRRQQWTIEPFPENLGPDGSVSSAASVSSQCMGQPVGSSQQQHQQTLIQAPLQQTSDSNDPCILTFSPSANGCSLSSIRSSSNGSSASDQDGCSEEHENVAIKSHLNKYLAVDSFGNVTCDSDEKTETARFTITICSMSQGRNKDEHIFWAFKNVERGYYLGTTDDARGASFFALKSLGRKRFARIADDEGPMLIRRESNDDKSKVVSQVQLDATITWGPETLFQFKYYEGGRYSLLTSDCRYFTNDGQCIVWSGPDESTLPPPECLFTLEYHSGFLAFRDSFSHYLAAAGRSSVLRSRSIGVSRDELFVFESAPIQVSLKATFNDRWVSIKQGVDLSANQTEISSKYETFQFNYHKQTQNWSIMTHDCNFWTVSHNTSTISVCKPADYEALTRGQFRLNWSDSDSTFSLKFVDANNIERWISARKSGQLYLATINQEPVKFIMRFQNRRLLNLRPIDGSGYVGLKAGTNVRQLEANKTCPDSISIEYLETPTLSGSSVRIFETKSSSNGPIVPAKPQSAIDNTEAYVQENRSVNMFNVRLNSTKMSQSVLDKLHESREYSRQEQQQTNIDNSPVVSTKQIDETFIDDNNNDVETLSDEVKPTNGNVESSSAPSVASIISSFSNAKLNSQTHHQQTNGASKQLRSGCSVHKLASTFESAASVNQLNESNSSDTASVITTCSSAASSSSAKSSSCANQIKVGNDINASQASHDQVAQFECCYMKLMSIDKYLIAGDGDSSVRCDATNKACAQSWVLELRSHNSIAVRASDNQAYMQLGTNGTIFLSRCEPREATLWEF